MASIDRLDEFIGFLVSFLNQSHEFLQFEYLNYYMHVTFFCNLEIYKKVLNTLVILDFICKEFVTSDKAFSP